MSKEPNGSFSLVLQAGSKSKQLDYNALHKAEKEGLIEGEKA